ncbi:CaiB/BaiF CoA transferase family protein [Hydrogenophaga sp. BPS33]|uniref:CaiB/BaiF CoA transferase family protein n=1 Tax=Hydrogenophaga sp. BPS33 TaxID=2651974 RepID=UPI0013203D35|nr:CoA transferase [Hydrogenophaga sp. BPS33]QHE83908.1 CoA transferase [Hydrogenophaga sp. BPS33]
MNSTNTPTSTGPLQGVRVLDLSAVVLGPIATQVLGDYGADVIKIESREGDVMRGNGTRNGGMSSIFLNINRNKRSLVVDLKTPEGVEVVRRLAKDVDVVVHNMRIKAINRLGLGYEDLVKVNPRLVYCVATGFDQDGPDRDKPAFDDTIQAACGLVGLTAGEGETPAYVRTLIADKTAGLALANAVMAALYRQAKTDQGQYVEVPMFETLVSFMLAEHLGGLAFDPPPAPAGYARLLGQGARTPVATSDGHIAILAYTVSHRRALFEELGVPELAEKYGAKSNGTLGMYDELSKFTRHHSTAYWLEVCERLDIPATRIYTLDDLPRHPQLAAIGLFQPTVHPTEGKIVTVRPTTKFSATPATVRSLAPTLGEHSRAILCELGYADAQIADLLERNVVVG